MYSVRVKDKTLTPTRSPHPVHACTHRYSQTKTNPRPLSATFLAQTHASARSPLPAASPGEAKPRAPRQIRRGGCRASGSERRGLLSTTVLMRVKRLALKTTNPHCKATKFCKKFLISTMYIASRQDPITINLSLVNCVVTEILLLHILSAKHARHSIPIRP